MHKNAYQEARECKSFPLWFKSAMDCNFTHIFFLFSLKKKKKSSGKQISLLGFMHLNAISCFPP